MKEEEEGGEETWRSTQTIPSKKSFIYLSFASREIGS